MIYIRTCARNAEKTLESTIESILNQTYTEFMYYLIDNGSTDRTKQIIEKYAEQDSRIVPFYGNANYDFSNNQEFWELQKNLDDGDYFCVLDADDTYELTFLEEMLRFQKENNLDIAICGTTFVDANTGQICGGRVLDKDLILRDNHSFDESFPDVHWNLRQFWGKLYTANTVKTSFDAEAQKRYLPMYGGDTMYVYDCIKVLNSIGVYSKSLHNYRISHGSVSYKWLEGRESCDFILYEKAIEVLSQKCGQVSSRNLNFLYAVQFNALKDTLRVLFNSDLSAERKVGIMKGIFENPITKQTFLEKGNVTQDEKTKLLTEVVCGVIELAKNFNESSMYDVADIFKVFNTSFSELIPTEHLGWYMKKLPMLVRNVALGEYEYSVNNLLVYLAKECEANLEEDYPFVLGQMLASLRNEEAKYVYFSKRLIRWCIGNNQLERARQDLDEWLQILPEDKELKELNKMC